MIFQNEVLPVFEQLGDVRNLLIGQAELAMLLQQMNAKANKARIEKLLRLALADAKRLKLPKEIKWIERIIKETEAAFKECVAGRKKIKNLFTPYP